MPGFEDVKRSEQVRTYILKANEALGALGYTEHSFGHVELVSRRAGEYLTALGYSAHQVELARIAGYLHDIGNVVNRIDHAQTGAIMAFRILDQMGFDCADVATIISAIGNHDESTAAPVNEVAAALILADKADVRRSRVRNQDMAAFDIHDRVNYAVTNADTQLSVEKKTFLLRLDIDTAISAVMEYFEIFLTRMLLCRRAAAALGLHFKLIINGQELL